MSDVRVTRPAEAHAAPLRVVPAHVLVLLATVGVALWLVTRGVREPVHVEQLTFATLFNAIVGAGLGLAWLLDAIVALASARGRGAPVRRLVRLLVVSLPLAGFVVGHWLLNPWAERLLREAWRAVR